MTAQVWPYVALLVVGYLPNEVWRYLALVMAHSLDEDSELVVLARTIATALITGVVAKLVVFSGGELAGFPLAVRLAAAAGGFTAFAIFRRSVFAGVAAGEALLIVGGLFFRH